MSKTTLGVALVCVAATAFAGQAFAQSAKPKAAAPAAAAPAARPLAMGPALPGVCIYSEEELVGGSAVGKFVIQRLGQLQSQVAAEVNGEKQSLETDAQAFETQKASLPADQAEQRVAQLNLRGNALQRKADLRNRELQATQQKALGRVIQEAEPMIRSTIEQRACSVVLNAQSVLTANPGMDITPSIIQVLDAKITQIQFDREHLDQAAGPAR
ncbi:MAG: OmpH family outer membrane protein [Caulobacteraceae bacterium]|nr:OmpH family outer membrane protein [Caulobacteraceae bacterium]